MDSLDDQPSLVRKGLIAGARLDVNDALLDKLKCPLGIVKAKMASLMRYRERGSPLSSPAPDQVGGRLQRETRQPQGLTGNFGRAPEAARNDTLFSGIGNDSFEASRVARPFGLPPTNVGYSAKAARRCCTMTMRPATTMR
jgi:hypothetical protein